MRFIVSRVDPQRQDLSSVFRRRLIARVAQSVNVAAEFQPESCAAFDW